MGYNQIYVKATSTASANLNASVATFTSTYSSLSAYINYNGYNATYLSGGTLNNCSFNNLFFYFYDNSNPIVTNSTISHTQNVIRIADNGSPEFHNNDIYNNITAAVVHTGSSTVDFSNNYWGHFSGPQHSTNPDGLGEIIEGSNITILPFLDKPISGIIEGEIIPVKYDFGEQSTGTRINSSFEIKNKGDIDLLITGISNKTANVSVKNRDRFWLLPDSAKVIEYSFTSLDIGEQLDTIAVYTNDLDHPVYYFVTSAYGKIEDLKISIGDLDIDSLPIVKCYVTVLDQSNIPITVLNKSNITLKENGKIVNDFLFQNKSENSIVISAALTIDKSGSMSGQYINDAKNAAIDFISLLSLQDKASVISFDDGVVVNQGFTSDKSLLIDAINSLLSGGGTKIYDAVDVALDETIGQEGNKAILVLSDGEDGGSSVSADDIIQKAVINNISIYTIGLGSNAESTLESIAIQTGGLYYNAPGSEDLSLIYRSISGQLQNQYELIYTALPGEDYPKVIEITIDFMDEKGSVTVSFSNESSTIEFLSLTNRFSLPKLINNSKSYFYYYVKETASTPVIDREFKFTLKSGSNYIPSGGKYIGNGIMQFWVDLRGLPEMSSIQINMPDSILQYGQSIKLASKPGSFNIPIEDNPVEQNIDIFGGLSAGVNLIAGGVGAGPSVAAAKLSLNTEGGMGFNFLKDLGGNEYITRRFEAGIGLSVESPAINAVVGEIQAGLNAEVMVKGLIGQTMHFPSTMNTSTIKKAKASYILETFSIGGVSLSPFAGVFLKALKNSLLMASPDLNSLYNSLYYQNLSGVAFEGSASVGFSIALDDDLKDQAKLEIADIGGYITVLQQNIENVKTQDKSFKFNIASGFDISVLNFQVGNIDLVKAYEYKFGKDVSIVADYSQTKGFNSLDLSFGATSSPQLAFADFCETYSCNFHVPKYVITKNLTARNLVGTIAPMLVPGISKTPFMVGINYFAENIDNLFFHSPDTLAFFEDHVLIQTINYSSKGLDISPKIKLDAALGAGAGLELGFQLAYYDEMYYPKNQYIIANGHLLPLVSNNDIDKTNRIFNLEDEIKDLFEGTALLIDDALQALIKVAEKVVEEGKEFLLNVYDGSCKVFGVLTSPVKIVIRTVDPSTKSVQRRTFLEPEVINAYSSRRVVSLENQLTLEEPAAEESILYIVSENHNISMFSLNDSLLLTFDPIYISIAVDPTKIATFNFGEDEKKLARIYFYDDLDSKWIELPGDLTNHLDTVTTTIINSGNYAVGISLKPSDDITAPDILDYYPRFDVEINNSERIWAKLYEAQTGVGIDFSRTMIKIDGNEVSSLWNPVDNIISFVIDNNISNGQHSFTIIASDLNGNTNITSGLFSYNSATSIKPLRIPLQFDCYPNPVDDYLNISLKAENNDPVLISVYNNLGQQISNLIEITPTAAEVEIVWNRTTIDNQLAPAGIYFVRIKQDEKIAVKKIILE
ncbi:MAG: VWA domain-containing protein [Bacteroidales bacterium]|nr:VWA domain-containing protein [Bacteroidales bacterium]